MAWKNCEIKLLRIQHTWNLDEEILTKNMSNLMESEEISLFDNYHFKLKLLVNSISLQQLFLCNKGTTPVSVKELNIHPRFIPPTNRYNSVPDLPTSLDLEPSEMSQIAKVVWNKDVSKILVSFTFHEREYISIKRGTPEEFPQSIPNTLTKDLESGLENQYLTDWTLICEEQRIPCHTLILGARSSVFKTMFANKAFVENKEKETNISDVKLETMKAMVKFLYTDKLDSFEVDISDLLFAAEKYDIPLLRYKCAEILANNLSVENVTDCFKASLLLEDSKLTVKTSNFIGKNITEVKSTDGWANLVKDPKAVSALEELFTTFSTWSTK